MNKSHILFVCLGNICRSPMAEGVLVKLVAQAGLRGRVRVDSAGTGAWHKGERADKRARTEAGRRGYELNSVARPLLPNDFVVSDLIIGMDQANVQDLMDRAPDNRARAKIKLLRDYDPMSPAGAEIPDPYYGSPEDFARTFDLVEAGCKGLFEQLQVRHSV